ncbi:MAG: ParB N-terminal domain-containing protein [Candidatus Fonsibacter sp.]
MKLVNINEVKPNPKNPRIIKDVKFNKLVTSIKEFPDMLNKRPLIVFTDVDNKYVVLGGNQRLRALKELKHETVPIIVADEWTEEQKNEFLIKDNVGFGEWDWDSLANEWDVEKLDDWGLDLPIDLDAIKETKDIPDIGEIEFSEELLLEHNYIVLYFDNAMDWEVAQEVYGLNKVKSKESSLGSQKIGIGRVLNGKNFI